MMETLLQANRVALPASPPSRILLLPWGDVESSSGDFIIDDGAAQAIVAAFKAKDIDIVIDHEHATLGGKFSTPDGTAPAMGWIKSLDVKRGVGIFGDVEWTKRGASFIANKEYRYLSPTIMMRQADRRVVRIHSASLTNIPAIKGMAAIANKDGGSTVDKYEQLLGRLREAMGKPEATESEIIAAIQAAVTTASANKDSDDESMFVLREKFDAAESRATTAEKQLKEIACKQFIENGERAGKITGGTKEHWLEMYQENSERAEKMLKSQPQIAPAEGRLITPGGASRASKSSRQGIIRTANCEFIGDMDELLKITNKENYINMRLTESGEKLLTPDEVEKL